MKTNWGIFVLAAVAASAFAWPSFQYGDSRTPHGQPPPPPPGSQHGSWDWQGQPPSPPPGGDWRDDHRDGHHGGHRGGHHSSGRHGYAMLGEFSAAGGAKEVSIGGNKTQVSIEFISGTTSINSIVLRSGGRKTPVTVVTRFTQGQRYDFNIGRDVTGLRISCSGNGRFRVYAR